MPGIGTLGEDAAAAWYERRGFRILARNWRCRIGELDVVASRDDLLVICEVKTRSSASFGPGWEAVTARKRAKLRCLAEAFLAAQPRWRLARVRFDVASVSTGSRGRSDVEVFEDAF